MMHTFDSVCNHLGVPIAHEKTEGPTTKMEYLGLTIDTVKMCIQIPETKVNELLKHINTVAFSKKVTLKQLQSLCGSLAFCTRALPAGRAFSRSLYMATSKATKPHHFIRITKTMFDDLMVWKHFLENFNGVSYILDKNWVSNLDLHLFTDSAGIGDSLSSKNNGCGVFFMGSWCYFPWPLHWHGSDIMKDMTFLEIIPIALAICLWQLMFNKKKIMFHVDNQAVVSILNSMTAKSERVLKVLRFIVYKSLTGNFHVKAMYISTFKNLIADSISRGQFQKFRQLVPTADTLPTMVPYEFLEFLNENISV